MKKLISLLLVILMLITTVGCSKPEDKVESAADANGDFHIAVSLPYTGTNASYAEYIDMGIKVALK